MSFIFVVEINLGQTISKYAVDIIFSNTTFEFNVGGNLIWNVNTLSYDNYNADVLLQDQVYSIDIHNYSDKPIYVKGELTERHSFLSDAYIEFEMTNGMKQIDDKLYYHTISGVSPVGNNGLPTHLDSTIDVTLKSVAVVEDGENPWNESIKAIINANYTGVFAIGKIVITISGSMPDPIDVNP